MKKHVRGNVKHKILRLEKACQVLIIYRTQGSRRMGSDDLESRTQIFSRYLIYYQSVCPSEVQFCKCHSFSLAQSRNSLIPLLHHLPHPSSTKSCCVSINFEIFTLTHIDSFAPAATDCPSVNLLSSYSALQQQPPIVCISITSPVSCSVFPTLAAVVWYNEIGHIYASQQ